MKDVPNAKEREELRKELDRIVRRILLKTAQACFTCDKTLTDHNKHLFAAGHLFSRSYKATRWNLMNCNLQCHFCNSYHEERPEIYKKAFINAFGQKEYDDLEKETKSPIQYKYHDLLDIKASLEEVLND